MNRALRIMAACAVTGGVIALANQLRDAPNLPELMASLALIALGTAAVLIARRLA